MPSVEAAFQGDSSAALGVAFKILLHFLVQNWVRYVNDFYWVRNGSPDTTHIVSCQWFP